MKEFALSPVKVPISTALTTLEFKVFNATYDLLAKDKRVGTDRLPVREFKRGSLQYRLRCVQLERDETRCGAVDWVVTDTTWPETVFVEVNDHILEVRRRSHHGKDLPIDITRHITPPTKDSINRIKMSVPRSRKTSKELDYYIAVELIEVLQHKQVMDMCFQHQRLPAAQTLDAIKASLAGPSDDDDEIAMVASDISIDLADPFTARIFDIPVRGSSCLHRECFDLETYLLTRNSKPKWPHQPCMIDVWKCPLCGKDARPYSLRIDDFLASVRAGLAEKDNLDVKAILISADGTWRPKPKPQPLKRKSSTTDTDDDSDEEATKKQKVLAKANVAQAKVIEIIELDDD